jgi:pilus assembly protein Flp/PilA
MAKWPALGNSRSDRRFVFKPSRALQLGGRDFSIALSMGSFVMRIVERTKDIAIRLWKDESGASLLEYSVLIGIITAAVIGTVVSVGGWVGEQWDTLDTALTGSGG